MEIGTRETAIPNDAKDAIVMLALTLNDTLRQLYDERRKRIEAEGAVAQLTVRVREIDATKRKGK